MNSKKLEKIPSNHALYLVDSIKGRNADLRNADLRNADLRNADLRNADTKGVNFIIFTRESITTKNIPIAEREKNEKEDTQRNYIEFNDTTGWEKIKDHWSFDKDFIREFQDKDGWERISNRETLS